MARGKKIDTANLDWDGDAPRSVFFDDIYFSGDGPAETTHVFLNGNDLPARFEKPQRFTIGELGFGAGLNFLAVWDAWRRAPKPAGAKLDFFSIEASPFSPKDMARAHGAWPAFSALAAMLCAQLPAPHHGFHRLELGGDVTLTLYYGDAADGLRATEASIDAWFLDGFAPARNPAMWAPEIFKETARLSNDNATFATFTVAGAVRRTLQDAGFAIEKRPGFGRKRDMLAGRLTENTHKSHRAAWFDTRETSRLKPDARIAIIGAGIAGAAMARALRIAGMAPTVFEANAPASGASGNPAGLIMPRLDADDTPAARFHVAAYLYTVQLLSSLQKNSSPTLFNQCGAVLHAHHDHIERESRRQKKLLSMNVLPDGWIEARADGLAFPQGGVVNPANFVKALLGETPVIQREVKQLEFSGGEWRITCASGDDQCFDAVVIANSFDALRFKQCRSLPLSGYKGQIDYFPNAAAPNRAHIFGPYIAPGPEGGLVIGATYARLTAGQQPSPDTEATRSNIKAVGQTFPERARKLDPEASIPRASIRCVTPDWMPVAGPMPDWGYYAGAYDGLRDGRRRDYPPGRILPGLYILSGLGSRGLVTAPLTAAMIAAEIAGAPAPVDYTVAEALHPARFFIRELKRARP